MLIIMWPQPLHWVCVELDLKEKVVRYYDSQGVSAGHCAVVRCVVCTDRYLLQEEDRTVVENVMEWLRHEAERKLGETWVSMMSLG